MAKKDTEWQAGMRVSRTDAQDLGTIVEVYGQIKVKWDNGRTSYYRNHAREINVQAAERPDPFQRQHPEQKPSIDDG